MSGGAIIASGNVLLWDANGNPLLTTNAGGNPVLANRIVGADGSSFAGVLGDLLKAGIFGVTGNQLVVDSNGAITTKNTPPTAPPGTTEVQERSVLTVSKLGGTATFSYVPGAGQDFRLQQLTLRGFIAAPNSDKQLNARATYLIRPNGAGSAVGEKEIVRLYLHRTPQAIQDYNDKSSQAGVLFIGDGTKAFYIAVVNNSQDDAELEVAIRGFY